MLLLYNAVLLPLRVAALGWAAWSSRRGGERAREWAERLARALPTVAPGGVWIHGASVGEARLVALIAGALRERRPHLPLSMSVVTRTGRAQLPGPPRSDAAFFAPLDFPGRPRRVLGAVRPRALVLLETELWPNLLREASLEEVGVALLNGRLSAERRSSYLRLRGLFRPLLEEVDAVGAQTSGDAERLVELGARPSAVVVTGNVKYDLPAPPAGSAERLRSRLGLPPGRPAVAAGSTGPGEEGQVLDAFLEARAGRPDLFLILAPRHPERIEEVSREVAARGLDLPRLSDGASRAGGADGLLVDTVGELAALYTLVSAAFVGGSLVPIGGHNVLEPAAAGVPVLFGPHTQHVASPAEALLRAGGARRVRDSHDLGRAWLVLLRDEESRRESGRRASAVVEANRGALGRSVDLVLSVVERRAAAGRGGAPP
jgi:3-deoxy-D-manno-octulosonic-acid transferase